MFAHVYVYIPHDMFPSHCCYFWWSRILDFLFAAKVNLKFKVQCFEIQSSMFLWFLKMMLTIRDRMVQELLLSLSPSYMWTISHTACWVCLGCSTFKFRTKCSDVCLFGFCLLADVHYYFVNSFTMTTRQLNSFYFLKVYRLYNWWVINPLHIGILNNSEHWYYLLQKLFLWQC